MDASNSTAKSLLPRGIPKGEFDSAGNFWGRSAGASTRARPSLEKEKSVENDVGWRNVRGFTFRRRPELEGVGRVRWTEEPASTISASPKRAISGSKLGILWSGSERMGLGVRVRVRRERMRR